MSIYAHVLCAADFSGTGDVAAFRAAALARQSGARFSLLHVVEYFPGERSNQRIPPEDVDPAIYETRRASDRLAELAARVGMPEAGVQVSTCENAAWHRVLEFAEAEGVDLIVLGRHGRHGAAALLGATAAAVQQRARCDVLTVCRGR